MSRTRVLAAATAAALLLGAWSGRANLYVRPWFVPVVVATGLGLAAVALRRDDTHGIGLPAAVLLAMPVVLGLSLTPELVATTPGLAPAAGTDVEGRIGEKDNPLIDGGGGPVTVLQVVLAERTLGGAALHRREVEVEAVVTDEGHVARLVMVCCAADARLVTIAVRGDLPAPDTWVRVTGVLLAEGTSIVLEASDIRTIPVPDDPLL